MYSIEIKPASKAVWYTPDEARSYYGRYNRTGITIHWWGDGSGAANHDNIVNFFLRRTDGSVNYVLSDNKITLMVNPDNVAWTSQAGNPTTISIEHQPTLGQEGYKKSGWLVWQLEERYGRKLQLFPHNYWVGTQCPGSISLDKIRQESEKWRSGAYNAQPNPVPTPPPTPTPPAPAMVTFTRLPAIQVFTANKQPTNLWRMDSTSWSMSSVKTFNKGEQITIYGVAKNNKLNAEYYITQYSYDNKIPNGFSKADLDLFIAPAPEPTPQPDPPPTPEPEPTPPEDPEWVTNLRDIDDTKMWFTEQTELIDITKGLPTGSKTFAKDEEIVASALTKSKGVEYRITDYSYKKNIFNGVPITSLTLTQPGLPDVPPVPSFEDRLNILEKTVKLLWDYLMRWKRFQAFVDKNKGS